jgi:hypothetical protein
MIAGRWTLESRASLLGAHPNVETGAGEWLAT